MKRSKFFIGFSVVLLCLTGCGQNTTNEVIKYNEETVSQLEGSEPWAGYAQTEALKQDQIQVSSEVIRRFLEGEGSATFTDSYRAFCEGFGWNFNKRYEGSIADIRQKCFEELAVLDTQTIDDFHITASDWRGTDFVMVTVNSTINYGEEKYLILKEIAGEVKICFEENRIERGGWVCDENGMIYMGFRESSKKYTQLCYYMNEAGDVLLVYRVDHMTYVPGEQECEGLSLEVAEALKNSEYETYLIGNESYVVDFPPADCCEEAEELLQKQLFEKEEAAISNKEEIVQKIEQRSNEVGIDFSLVSTHL